MPAVTFKTITQISFTLELEESKTIGEVKKLIHQEKGEDYAVELQKLIYNGKILDDATTVKDAGIDTNKFVVVMLGRKKPAEAPAASAPPAAVTAAAPAPIAESAPVPAAAPVSTPAAPAAPAGNNLTAEQTEKLETIMGMGYTRDQSLRALNLADWDPNRAVNLLLSGSDDFDAAPIAGGAPELEEEGDDVGSASLEDLANLPQFEELRNIIRTNPQQLPELMRDIAQHNPQLMNAISQNQGAFLQMMSASVGGGAGQPRAGGAPPSGENVIRLSAEDAAAVQRIKSMGLNVPDALIVEAYLACDKNEDMAVSYIIDAMEQE